ncbi:MAG: Energy-coupling factor transporter transmembrane protein EcfT [Syntrophomonadaceae bacterium]|nr:Energy-coupling factor transporter transmembrane protein EcfT [Bacillota bacterium]
MFKSIIIGQYLPGDTFLHRLDPRAKIIALALLIAAIFSIRSYWGYLVMAAVVPALLQSAKVPLTYAFRGLRPVLYILCFTVLVHFLTTRGGEVLLHFGPLRVESDGVYLGLFMALRIIFLVITTLLLTLTTSPIVLTDGLEYLMKPLKGLGVPAHEIAMMMTMALRFIPTLMEESDRLMKAQMARGADFTTGSIFHRARSLLPLLVPLFVSVFRRADELAIAMEARCYRGGEGRTRLYELKAKPRDFAGVASAALLLAVIVWARL